MHHAGCPTGAVRCWQGSPHLASMAHVRGLHTAQLLGECTLQQACPAQGGRPRRSLGRHDGGGGTQVVIEWRRGAGACPFRPAQAHAALSMHGSPGSVGAIGARTRSPTPRSSANQPQGSHRAKFPPALGQTLPNSPAIGPPASRPLDQPRNWSVARPRWPTQSPQHRRRPPSSPPSRQPRRQPGRKPPLQLQSSQRLLQQQLRRQRRRRRQRPSQARPRQQRQLPPHLQQRHPSRACRFAHTWSRRVCSGRCGRKSCRDEHLCLCIAVGCRHAHCCSGGRASSSCGGWTAARRRMQTAWNACQALT